MTYNKIKINGKYINYSVNTSEEVNINWGELEVRQYAFNATVTRNNKIIYDSKKIVTDDTFLVLKLPVYERREKLTLTLEIFSDDTHKVTKEVVFYTGNNQLTKANWITRLDNPIEKETEFFKDKPNIIMKKEFKFTLTSEPVFLDICGLGYYIVKINGKKIDDSILNTDLSNFSQKIYYNTYEIKQFLVEGCNEIYIELGNGWYNPAPIKILGKYNYRNRLSIGDPCLICQITYIGSDNIAVRINSDSSWGTGDGNYTFNSLFIGEKIELQNNNQDLGEAFDGKTVRIAGPGGELVPSHIPDTRRIKTYSPKKVITDENNNIVMDFGRIISGQVKMTFSKNIQDKIRLFYSEELDSEGNMDYKSSISGVYNQSVQDKKINENDPVVQMDEINKGNNIVTFENKFVYHSFRFVLVEVDSEKGITKDDITDVLAYSVHTDVVDVSSFTTSSDALNDLWEAALQTKKNNIHSIFEDCPRERLGYGGDIVALLKSQIYSFDVEQLFIKVMDDFSNDQARSGGITQTAPYIGIQTNGPSDKVGSVGWQLVYPELLLALNKYYYNPNILDRFSENVSKHIEYLLSFDYDYIKHCCLGDWGSIDSVTENRVVSSPDREFCSAIMYYLILKRYKEVISNKRDTLSSQLDMTLKKTKDSILKEFYNSDGFFQSGSQSSYIFALYSEILGDELRSKLLDNFIKKISRDNGVFRTGIFGMSWTFEILSKAGKNDIIINWLLRNQYPSFLDMLSRNNKVLGEYFDGNKGSLNHAMFSSYSTWLFERIVGIAIQDDAINCDKIQINPIFPDVLEYASGELNTIRGRVISSWEKEDGKIKLNFKIPKNMSYKLNFQEEYIIEKIDKKKTDNYSEIIEVLLSSRD